MRRFLLVCAVWFAGASAAYAIDKETAFTDPVMNARYLSLIREIRCPKCLNESIADSDAPVAADLRREVRRLMGEGKPDDEVKDFLAARYGDFVLYRPRVTEKTWAIWAGPFVFLGIGGIVFWRIVRSRLRQSLNDEESAA